MGRRQKRRSRATIAVAKALLSGAGTGSGRKEMPSLQNAEAMQQCPNYVNDKDAASAYATADVGILFKEDEHLRQVVLV